MNTSAHRADLRVRAALLLTAGLAAASCGAPSPEEATGTTHEPIFIARLPRLLGNVSWNPLGSPGLTRVAVCNDGRAYGLRGDGALMYAPQVSAASWQVAPVQPPPGLDPWQRRYWRMPPVTGVLCAGNELHVFTREHQLLRARGSVTAPHFELVAAGMWGTREVAGTTVVAGIFPLPTFVALNGDNSIHQSSSGTVTGWQMQGQRTDLPFNRIAVGGAIDAKEVYALAADGTLWANTLNACDAGWRRLSWVVGPAGLQDVTAAGQGRLYGIAPDGTLWEGTVTRERREVTLNRAHIQEMRNRLQVTDARLRLDTATGGAFFPSEAMLRAGVRPRTFAITPQEIAVDVPTFEWDGGPEIGSHRVVIGTASIEDVSLRGDDVEIELREGALRLALRFEEDGREVFVTPPFPSFDVEDFRFDVDVAQGAQRNRCGRPQMELDGLTFHGDLRARLPLVDRGDAVLTAVTQLERRVEREAADGLRPLVADPALNDAIEQAVTTLGRATLQIQGAGDGWVLTRDRYAFHDGTVVVTFER